MAESDVSMAAVPEPAPLVYVSCAEDRAIRVFRLDAQAVALEPVEVVPVPGGEGASPSNMPLAFNAGGTMLYAALRRPPFHVASFSVDRASGRLAPMGTAPLPAAMTYIAVAGGGLLLAASYTDGKLSVSRIGADGVVRDGAVQVVETDPKAHCIIAGRCPGSIYATTVHGNAILHFRLDAEAGRLIPAAVPQVTLRAGSGPRHLMLHPALDVLYCVTETAGTLAAFTVEPGSGALREMQYENLVAEGFQGNARAADLHLTPDGRFAYASVRPDSIIKGFRVDPASGRLAPIGTFNVEGSPRGFGIDPNGRFIICGGQDGNTIGLYEIDQASGALTLRQRIAAGGNPSWVETRRGNGQA